MNPLKAEHFLWLVVEGEVRKIGSMRRMLDVLLLLKVEPHVMRSVLSLQEQRAAFIFLFNFFFFFEDFIFLPERE